MIRYRLGCINRHPFESWFRDSAAFDEQIAAGLLSCPVCGASEVTKSIMAPAVVGGATGRGVSVEPAPPAPPDGGVSLLDPQHKAIRAAMRAIRTKILTEGHDVGRRFPEEARLMHEGATPRRPIHGEATFEEAKDLVEDGIMILPLPPVPEELN